MTTAGPVAAAGGAPLLLTPVDGLPRPVVDYLEEREFDRVVVAGGPAAVSEAVAARLEDLAGDVERVAGRTRLETAAALARRGGPGRARWLADAYGFADAVAAAAAVANLREPLLLADGNDLDASADTIAVLTEQPGELELVNLVGGPAAIAQTRSSS